MTLLIKGHGHAIFIDGDTTPTIRQDRADPWRPPKEDQSWRVEDEATGRVVDEYHPSKPRHSRITQPATTRS